MAAGEWISVRSQVELYEGIVAEIRTLAQRNPRLILDELTTKLRDTGFATDTAQRVATELPLDDERFVSFSARTVFGFDTEQLGSPTTAAVSSLGLFAVGALVPLVPWFITSGTPAIVASIVATAVASVAVGGWVSRSSGRPDRPRRAAPAGDRRGRRRRHVHDRQGVRHRGRVRRRASMTAWPNCWRSTRRWRGSSTTATRWRWRASPTSSRTPPGTRSSARAGATCTSCA